MVRQGRPSSSAREQQAELVSPAQLSSARLACSAERSHSTHHGTELQQQQ